MTRKISVKNLLILTAAVAIFAAFTFPKLFFQFEKSKAAVAEVVLISTLLAENEYYGAHQRFSSNWKDIESNLAVPGSVGVSYRDVEGMPSARFYMLDRSGATRDGFVMRLHVDENGQQGYITALRGGTSRYKYTLEKQFPLGRTTCTADNARSQSFCQWFNEYTKSLILHQQAILPEVEN